METIWKDTEGYDLQYQVSNTGLVREVKRDGNETMYKPITIYTDRNGHQSFNLPRNGKRTTARVAQLVAKAFVKNPFNLHFVNHIDGNPSNNNASNLEWVVRSKIAEKISRSMKDRNAGKTPHARPVLMLDTEGNIIKEFPSVNQAAKYLHTNTGNIWLCLNARMHTTAGYRWCYKECYKKTNHNKTNQSTIKKSNTMSSTLETTNLSERERACIDLSVLFTKSAILDKIDSNICWYESTYIANSVSKDDDASMRDFAAICALKDLKDSILHLFDRFEKTQKQDIGQLLSH